VIIPGQPYAAGTTKVRTSSYFNRFSNWTARATGRPLAFGLAFLSVLIWAVTGPLFQFSDTWQLVINTSTTIITFLMVFLIQSTQNRDTQALQVKLDELIRTTHGAHNSLLDLENLDQDELERIAKLYAKLAEDAKCTLKTEAKTGTPKVDPQEGLADTASVGTNGNDRDTR
jgi:low affinity Fe/Cu permease